MPQFWIALFFILLAIAQLYQSVKDIALPMPVYLGLSVLLAVASNYQYRSSLPTNSQPSLSAVTPVLSDANVEVGEEEIQRVTAELQELVNN